MPYFRLLKGIPKLQEILFIHKKWQSEKCDKKWGQQIFL